MATPIRLQFILESPSRGSISGLEQFATRIDTTVGGAADKITQRFDAMADKISDTAKVAGSAFVKVFEQFDRQLTSINSHLAQTVELIGKIKSAGGGSGGGSGGGGGAAAGGAGGSFNLNGLLSNLRSNGFFATGASTTASTVAGQIITRQLADQLGGRVSATYKTDDQGNQVLARVVQQIKAAQRVDPSVHTSQWVSQLMSQGKQLQGSFANQVGAGILARAKQTADALARQQQADESAAAELAKQAHDELWTELRGAATRGKADFKFGEQQEDSRRKGVLAEQKRLFEQLKRDAMDRIKARTDAMDADDKAFQEFLAEEEARAGLAMRAELVGAAKRGKADFRFKGQQEDLRQAGVVAQQSQYFNSLATVADYGNSQALSQGGFAATGKRLVGNGVVTDYRNRFGSTASLDETTKVLTQQTSMTERLSGTWSKFTGALYADRGVISQSISTMFAPLKWANEAWTGIGNTMIRVSALIYSMRRLGSIVEGAVADPLKYILESTEKSREFQNSISTAAGGAAQAKVIDSSLLALSARSPLTLSAYREAGKSFAINPYFAPQLAGPNAASAVEDYARTAGKLRSLSPEQSDGQTSLAIKNFLAGQYRSIQQRFEIQPEAIAASIGKSLDQLNTPELREKALKTYVDIFVSDDQFNKLGQLYSVRVQKLYDTFQMAAEKIGNSGIFDSVVKKLTDFNQGLVAEFNSPDFSKNAVQISSAFDELVTNISQSGAKLLGGLAGVDGDASSIGGVVNLATQAISKLAEASSGLPQIAQQIGSSIRSLSDAISDMMPSLTQFRDGVGPGVASTLKQYGTDTRARVDDVVNQKLTIQRIGETLQRMYGFGAGLSATDAYVGSHSARGIVGYTTSNTGAQIPQYGDTQVEDYEVRPDLMSVPKSQRKAVDAILRHAFGFNNDDDLFGRYTSNRVKVSYADADSATALRRLIDESGVDVDQLLGRSVKTASNAPTPPQWQAGVGQQMLFDLQRRVGNALPPESDATVDAVAEYKDRVLALFANIADMQSSIQKAIDSTTREATRPDWGSGVFRADDMLLSLRSTRASFSKGLVTSVIEQLKNSESLPPEAQVKLQESLINGTDFYSQQAGQLPFGVKGGIGALPQATQLKLLQQYRNSRLALIGQNNPDSNVDRMYATLGFYQQALAPGSAFQTVAAGARGDQTAVAAQLIRDMMREMAQTQTQLMVTLAERLDAIRQRDLREVDAGYGAGRAGSAADMLSGYSADPRVRLLARQGVLQGALPGLRNNYDAAIANFRAHPSDESAKAADEAGQRLRDTADAARQAAEALRELPRSIAAKFYESDSAAVNGGYAPGLFSSAAGLLSSYSPSQRRRLQLQLTGSNQRLGALSQQYNYDYARYASDPGNAEYRDALLATKTQLLQAADAAREASKGLKDLAYTTSNQNFQNRLRDIQGGYFGGNDAPELGALLRGSQPSKTASINAELAARRSRLQELSGQYGSIRQDYLSNQDDPDAKQRFEDIKGAILEDQQAILQLEDSLDEVKHAFMDFASSVRQSLQSGIGESLYSLETHTGSVADAFRNMAQSIMHTFADLQARLLTNALIGNFGASGGQDFGGGGLFGSLLGSLFSGSAGAGTSHTTMSSTAVASQPFMNPFSSPTLAAANGGIFSGGFKAFANGGVVTSPTLGLVGEGRYNEAIVPLPDGRNLPVALHGGGDAGAVHIYHVHDPAEAFRMGYRENKDILIGDIQKEVDKGQTRKVFQHGRR